MYFDQMEEFIRLQFDLLEDFSKVEPFNYFFYFFAFLFVIGLFLRLFNINNPKR